jgi:serine phosphatase RsbU (regulator of sigma subunit)
MYSDGYHDQVGGEKFTSFGMRNFENLLKKIDVSPEDSIEQLNKEFQKWKGDVPQVDDILVLGFQF